MIVAPADGSDIALLLSIYQLGLTEGCPIRGKSKSVHILDTVENFLDNPYSSERSPLGVKPPLGPATPTIAPYSVVHAIGFSCKLIVLAVDEMMRDGVHEHRGAVQCPAIPQAPLLCQGSLEGA